MFNFIETKWNTPPLAWWSTLCTQMQIASIRLSCMMVCLLYFFVSATFNMHVIVDTLQFHLGKILCNLIFASSILEFTGEGWNCFFFFIKCAYSRAIVTHVFIFSGKGFFLNASRKNLCSKWSHSVDVFFFCLLKYHWNNVRWVHLRWFKRAVSVSCVCANV